MYRSALNSSLFTALLSARVWLSLACYTAMFICAVRRPPDLLACDASTDTFVRLFQQNEGAAPWVAGWLPRIR